MSKRLLSLLAAVIESADDAVITKTPRGIITSWNLGAERIFGYTSAEALGKPATLLFPADRLAEEARILETIVRGERVDHFETTRLRKDGKSIDVSVTISPIFDPSGEVIGASKIARDITRQKAAQRKLQSQLARLSLLQQITHAIDKRQDLHSILAIALDRLETDLPVDFASVLSFDGQSRELIVDIVGRASLASVSPAVLEVGHSVEIDAHGFANCLLGRLIYEPDVATLDSAFARRLVAAGLRSLVLTPLLANSGTFGIMVTARRDPEAFSSGECEFLRQLGEHVGLAAHQAQLHESLQLAYEDLRQSQQVILQQERLRAVGEMASGIAHDINNAISPIVLYTESLLERETGLSDLAREQLLIVQRAAGDVVQTLGRMREFYRVRDEAAPMVPVDLNVLVQQVVDLTRARWSGLPQQDGMELQMRLQLADNLPAIMAVDHEVRDALTNLVFNAVDAMPDGGTLTLHTRVLQHNDQSDGIGEQTVQVEVADTGAGMDDHTRRRCLEPFFTTKGKRGTGMGLAMVYGMATRHDAKLAIASEPGVGTSVCLSFAPVSRESIAAEPKLAVKLVPASRVLVVDDDAVTRRSIREALEADGHVVVEADGGRSGIDAFLAALSAAHFELVITDLGMPSVDGRQVAAAVKEASPSTPVLLLTGWGQRLLEDKEVLPHVDRILGKPPRLRQLRQAMIALLDPHQRGIG